MCRRIIQPRTIWSVLIWFVCAALAVIPIVIVQLKETTAVLGGTATTEFYRAYFGWPFKAAYAIKMEHGNGIEYDLKQLNATEIFLDTTLSLILAIGALLFLRRVWMIRRLSFSMAHIFALTFAVAVCLLLDLRGFQLYLWTHSILKLDPEALWIQLSYCWWQWRIAETYLFVGSFAAFLELMTIFGSRTVRLIPATDTQIS